MFVLKNAWAAVMRRKWRSLLTLLIALLVTFGSMFGLAVAAENETANGATYDAQQANATITLSDKGFEERDGADPTWPDDHLMSWDDYTAFATAAQSAGLQFSYTVTESVPVRQSESIKPVGTADEASADDTGGELTLRGFYTLDAARANDLGRYRVVEGKHLSYSGRAPKGALISREVADANGLKVGDTFTVGHPTDADTTMEMTVRGIYEYVDDDAPSGRGDDASLSKDNRQNAIYVSAYTFIVSNNLDSGEETGWAKPDLSIMFMLSSPDDYQLFVKAAKKADAELKDGYEISSPSLEAYRKSIAPLGALNDTMRITMIALWVAGGLLLVALVVSDGLRRREEIGYALTVGVSKARLGWQFMLEVWMVILPAFAIGALAGGFAAGPLGAALADGHATSMTADVVWTVVGAGLGCCLALALVAMLRVAAFRRISLFDSRSEVTA